MQKLYRLISLGMLIVLTLSACSGAASQVVQDQPLAGATVPQQPARVDTSPKFTVTPAVSSPATPTNPPAATAATPVSDKILAHPQGCSPAALPQSVLALAWSDRNRENSLFPVDATTGQPLCKYEPLSIGWWFVPAISPQGDRLAITVSEREDGWYSTLRWIDLKSWQVHETSIEFPRFVIGLKFSPDGQKLAISAATSHYDSFQVVIVDMASQSVLAETTLGFFPRLLSFNADGSNLVVYGSPDSPLEQETSEARVVLLDSTTLDSLWETTLPGVVHGQIQNEEGSSHPEEFEIWEPAVVYSPIQDKLYIVHADSNHLTGVDFTARATTSADILPATSWLERLLAWTAGVAHAKVMNGFFKSGVISPDGSRLYVLGWSADSHVKEDGSWEPNETYSGLKVIETASGAEIAHLDIQANELEFSADGQSLLLSSWMDPSWTEVLDAKSLEVKLHVDKQRLYMDHRLDGQPVVLSMEYHPNGQTTLKTVDPVSFADISSGWRTLYASWLVTSTP